jgi:ubiquitin-conjugating enzyme E2 G2
MAGSALRRLMAEYKRNFDYYLIEYNNKIPIRFLLILLLYEIELSQNPPEGIVAGPINEENFFEWESLITYQNISYIEQLLIIFFIYS